MAFGSVTHLWIDATPAPETLRRWVTDGTPNATEGDLVVYRLGTRTLLSAINVSHRDARRRSEEVVAQTSVGADVGSTLVEFNPDHGSYSIDREAIDPADAAQVAAVRARLARVLELEVDGLDAYVEWGQALEETPDVERLAIGLPPSLPLPPQPPPIANGEQVSHPWRWIVVALVGAALFLKFVL